jgi:hypothetical protein
MIWPVMPGMASRPWPEERNPIRAPTYEGSKPSGAVAATAKGTEDEVSARAEEGSEG